MVLIYMCIFTILGAIVINAFVRNINAVIGFTLALINYIALQLVLGTLNF